MGSARRPAALAIAVIALAVLTAGIVRAVDISDAGSPSAAAKSAHSQHAGGGATAMKTTAGQHDPAAAGEHDAHALGGPPPAALDNGAYVLRLDQQVVPVGTRRFSFAILDAKTGQAVTRFQEDLTKRLHLIVVRQDLTGFQHVHPTLGPNGVWRVDDAVLMRPGPWRFIADFIPQGAKRAVLAASVHAGGGAYRVSPPRESARAGAHGWRTTVAGYDVTMRADGFGEGGDGELQFTVRRGDRSVVDLQPYLGSRGHTVLLRWGDVAYVHVHPVDEPTPPGRIDFAVTYPRVPPLKVFFQFRHRGVVRTAVFGLTR